MDDIDELQAAAEPAKTKRPATQKRPAQKPPARAPAEAKRAKNGIKTVSSEIESNWEGIPPSAQSDTQTSTRSTIEVATDDPEYSD